jgi:hypothetical protein
VCSLYRDRLYWYFFEAITIMLYQFWLIINWDVKRRGLEAFYRPKHFNSQSSETWIARMYIYMTYMHDPITCNKSRNLSFKIWCCH